MSWFSDRRAGRDVAKLLSLLGDTKLTSVADVGAGRAHFTVALAHQLGPQVKLWAVEYEAEQLPWVKDRLAAAGLSNVEVAQSSETHVNLPDASCDMLILRGVYHHFTKPEVMNTSMHRALRPGGKLAIIDFPPSWFWSRMAPLPEVPKNRGGHGITPQLAIQELTQAGFVLQQRIKPWSFSWYGLIFQKS